MKQTASIVRLIVLSLFGAHLAATPAHAQDEENLFQSRITTGNNVGLTVFNDGFIGNNLVSRDPSFEFPLGSDIEHLVRAGVWVGAVTARLDTLVSTATVAGSYGSRNSEEESEFVPVTGITELSTLPNSRYFSPDARSEQDFRFSYADTVGRTRQDENHIPLGVQVDTETLLFSFEPFDAIILMNLTIRNINEFDPLLDAYVGMYAELATGYKEPDEERWQSGWFGNKDIAWVDSLRLCTEHHFNDDNGNAPAWSGYQLLGARDASGNAFEIDSLTVSFNWWNWDDEIGRVGDAPIFDKDRYRTLSNGNARPTDGSEAGNNDPVKVISVGPFPVIEPGGEVTVTFAWVGGEEDRRAGRSPAQDIIFNAGWAQTAFDLDLNIPLPPPSPQLHVTPQKNKLTLRWTDDPENFVDPESGRKDFEGYRVYVSESRLESEFLPILEADVVDSVFYNTGLESLIDPVVIDETEYKYRFDITSVRDGFKYWTAVTAFDTGTPEIESLESGLAQNRTFAISGTPSSSIGVGDDVVVFPNPYRGDAAWDGALGRDRYLWFANLPARCMIRIYTLAGDLVDSIEFDADTYQPTDIRGIYDPSDSRNPESDLPRLPGGMAAWDLVTRKDQGVASGLYLFAVEDLQSGDKQVGKFMILK